MPGVSKYLVIMALASSTYAGFGIASEAEAQSRVCRGLLNQLTALDRQPVSNNNINSKQYRKYSDAIRKQQIEISKTSKLSKRNRCTGLGLFNSRSAQCKRIVSSLKKMQGNLKQLKRTRDQFTPSQTGNSRKRRILLAKIERNGCSTDSINLRSASANPERKSRRRTLLEQIFGVRTYRDSGSLSDGYNDDFAGSGTTFRTLCVRKTDGYYFPISFSTTRSFFERDEQACSAMCPGVDVALYHHRMPGQDSEDMVAYGTEFPYAQERFAFAYRKAVDRSTQCNFALRESPIAFNTNPRAQVNPHHGFVGIPEFKTDRSLAPDDADVIKGKLSIAKIEKLLIAANAPEQDPAIARNQDGRKVRIVGPAFFPVQ